MSSAMAGAPPGIEALQQTMERAVNELQRTRLIPQQKEAYLCAARCCDAPTAHNGPHLQRCVDGCQVRLQNANVLMQRMLGDFQERVQRCMMRCQDAAQESLPTNPSPKDAAKAEASMLTCLNACGQEYSGKVPKLKADVEAALKKLPT